MAIAGLCVMTLGLVLWKLDVGPRSWDLKITAGDALGPRHRLATVLSESARSRGVNLTIEPTSGSAQALEWVESGKIDLAMIQGGLTGAANVRQVTALYPEPLHLLVKPDLDGKGIASLRGRRLNLGAAGSGTRYLATEVLSFAGLQSGRDFTDESFSYEQLRAMPPDQLPDAVFAVLSIPSELANWFVRERGYRLMELPFAESLGFRDFAVVPARIPLMTYSVDPPVPPKELQTVGNYLLIVAREDVPEEAIDSLLLAIYDGSFARSANLMDLSPDGVYRTPEKPLHDGTLKYRDRRQPFLTTEAIDNIESMRSFIVSSIVALLLIWRWYSQRRIVGFDKYLNEVTEIEKKALKLEMVHPIDLGEAQRLRARLGELKTEAIEKFALGDLKGEEFMNSFLVHVTDVRTYLNSLILYERERRDEIEMEERRDG